LNYGSDLPEISYSDDDLSTEWGVMLSCDPSQRAVDAFKYRSVPAVVPTFVGQKVETMYIRCSIFQ
jgi:hypothetical protein